MPWRNDFTCNMICQGLSAIFIIKSCHIKVATFLSQIIYNAHQVRCYHFFIFEVIVESVHSITDVKLEKKIIINMMENNYFFQKLTWKHRAKTTQHIIFVLLKMYWRRLDQDEYVRLSLTSSDDVFVFYIRLGHAS